MKQNFARTLSCMILVMSFVGVVPLFADENTVNLESAIVQDFSKPEAQNWFVLGSKFSTKPSGEAPFPRLSWANAWPQAGKTVYGSTSEKDIRALGVAMLFDRKEFNWVDVVPGIKTGGDGATATWKPIELPLPGRIKAVDIWVWSGNFDYYLEGYFRDYKGIVHVLNMGNLSYKGWKNLRVAMPDSVPQSRKYLPNLEQLKLVKFRIWTRPNEAVVSTQNAEASALDRSVKFYFSNIKVLTDTFESIYDGENLSSPSLIQDTWNQGAKK